jgi:iron complex transport system ATP-binding protein
VIRLEARRLTVAIGERVLCRELSVTFRAGENWVVLGANGSGKTTLLHTLAGLRSPISGTVELDGRALDRWPARARAQNLGLLFQEYALAFPSTVLETVLTGRHPHLGRWALDGGGDRVLARAALAAVGLAGFENRRLDTLSGGERRRVEIAALLAQDPPIGLWDEPANHLDLRHQSELLRTLAARAQRRGGMNVFVLHDVNAAQRLATHAVLLFSDTSVTAGPAAEVITRDSLERLYNCAFDELPHGALRYYVPT